MEQVLGRKTLYYGEMRRMIVAENVFNGYLMRKSHTKGWADWAEHNKDLANLLFEAEKLCSDE